MINKIDSSIMNSIESIQYRRKLFSNTKLSPKYTFTQLSQSDLFQQLFFKQKCLSTHHSGCYKTKHSQLRHNNSWRRFHKQPYISQHHLKVTHTHFSPTLLCERDKTTSRSCHAHGLPRNLAASSSSNTHTYSQTDRQTRAHALK